MPTTTTTTKIESIKVTVHFLAKVEGAPSSAWPVERSEEMTYSEYMALPIDTLALTRVDMDPSDAALTDPDNDEPRN